MLKYALEISLRKNCATFRSTELIIGALFARKLVTVLHHVDALILYHSASDPRVPHINGLDATPQTDQKIN